MSTAAPRLLSRRRRTGRRSHQRSVLATIAPLVVFLAVCGGAIWLALTSQDGIPWQSYYVLHVRMPNLSGLAAHNDVRLAGNRVGQILDPRIQDGHPMVDVQISQSVGSLPVDTRFTVRSKGLLGGRFLEVDEGTSQRKLPNGATVAAAQSGSTVELPELLSTLDAPHRHDAQELINALGVGFLGRGDDVGRTLTDAPAILSQLQTAAADVNGRPGAASRFFPAIDSAAAAANPVRQDIANGFAPAATALRPFGDQRVELDQALSVAPSALSTVRAGLAQTDPLLVQARSLTTALSRMLPPAPAALTGADHLLTTASRQLPRANVLLDHVASPVHNLLALATPLRAELPRLDAGLTSADPILKSLSSNSCYVRQWANNWSSMLGWGVPGGGAIGQLDNLRLELIIGPGSVQNIDGPTVVKNPYPQSCAAIGQAP
jgi:ABC-type transporter Mla subunit MlaD